VLTNELTDALIPGRIEDANEPGIWRLD
jgi:hypothetical protein